MKINHFTINVTDHEKSTRFYCQGLGFKHVDDQVVGNEGAGPVLLTGDYEVHSRHLLVKEGFRIILNKTTIPSEPLPDYRRQLGLTNIAIEFNGDLDTIMAKLKALGGTPVPESKATFSGIDVMVCLDPDGQPVEMIALPK